MLSFNSFILSAKELGPGFSLLVNKSPQKRFLSEVNIPIENLLNDPKDERTFALSSYLDKFDCSSSSKSGLIFLC